MIFCAYWFMPELSWMVDAYSSLCLYVPVTNLDGIQFIGADAAIQDFFAACRGVEKPLAARLHKRNREREFVVADHKNGAVGLRRIVCSVCFSCASFAKLFRRSCREPDRPK